MTAVRPTETRDREPRAAFEPAHPAFELVHALVLQAEAEVIDINRVLEQLASAFQAREAGLAGVNGNRIATQVGWSETSTALPEIDQRMNDWPDNLPRAWGNVSGLPVTTANGDSLLLVGIRHEETLGWIVWVGAEQERRWTAAERAALALVGEVLVRVLTNQSGNGKGTTWLQRGRRQQRLEQAAGIVARLIHDFNNVLTGVLGFAELGLAQSSPGSSAYQFLNEAYQAAQQGSALANQIALFSRRSPTRPGSTALARLVGEEQTRLQKEAPDGLSVLVDLPSDLAAVAINSEPLRTVLHHLIDNARDAMAAGGVLAISARETELFWRDCLSLLGTAQPGKHIELTIADTGTGFTPEAQERVLAEPFYTTKPRHRGLGLPTVYGILCGHGGGIRIEHGRRQGTVVKVYLPARGAIGRPEEPLSKAASSTSGEKVLVVDDDPLALQLMCTTLERAGYRVETAPNGLQALSSIHNAPEPFGLVVADVIMPQMTGFDLAERLLERDPKANLLFTSGHMPAGFLPKGLASRQLDMLQKPFRPEGLLRAVRSALDRQGLRPSTQRRQRTTRSAPSP
jgi:signal transduction histidine kinase/CheY-like chemotaxis protein